MKHALSLIVAIAFAMTAYAQEPAPTDSAMTASSEIPKAGIYQMEYSLVPMLTNMKYEDGMFVFEAAPLDELLMAMSQGDFGYDFNVAEITTDYFDCDSIRFVVYTFPTPTQIPEAKYGAFAFRNGKAKYFTLELSLPFSMFSEIDDSEEPEPCWVFGTTRPGEHSNYGVVPPCATPEEFVNLLLKAPQNLP